jgi:OmpR-family two-component system manganese-sensing sensor histidine kinase
VEGFTAAGGAPLLRLGEPITLPPQQPPDPPDTRAWQQGPASLALVRPRAPQGSSSSTGGIAWLRVSTSLEPMQRRLRQLDLTLAAAVGLALLLSAAAAVRLSRRSLWPLEQHLDRLRQFSVDASHELRGPLAALAANLEMALLETPAGASTQRRRFEAMASATDQMAQLVDGLLLVARHEGAALPQPTPVDLTALLAEQVALQQAGYRVAGLSLASELESDLTVLAQPALLQRIFRNLLDNARQYTPRGGRVALRAQRSGTTVRVEVEDTGYGLRPEEAERVFDRLWQARPDRGGGGNGLGLAIASSLCQAHGGRIEVHSSHGQGSCFTVHLPLQPSRGALGRPQVSPGSG